MHVVSLFSAHFWAPLEKGILRSVVDGHSYQVLGEVV